jgi:hypothetical protein
VVLPAQPAASLLLERQENLSLSLSLRDSGDL